MSSPTNKTDQSGFARQLLTLGILLSWFAVLVVVAFNRQNIIDWWQLRNYDVPAAVSSLAQQDTMTDYGRKVFYVNKPFLSDKAAFNTACPNNGGEQTIVLGCYHANQAGIFLLNVSEPRLNGVEQVTAAHEMLHAAYDRLNDKERPKIDALLMKYYQNGLTDKRVATTIEAYKKSEPNDVVNEMHSIFGTEITNLPAELEEYYGRYFTNRSQIVAFATQYQAAFSTRQAKIAEYDAQLASLKGQIDALEADLKQQNASIEAQQNNLTNLRNSGNIAAYNAGVAPHNAAVDAYNVGVARLKALIEHYNQLVASRNAVAAEQDQLVQKLNSKANPIEQ